MAEHVAPPAWLAGASLEKWTELQALREWRPSQLDHVAAYCAAYGRWVDAERWLAEPGNGPVVTIVDAKGNVKMHATAPQVLVGERAAKEMARLAKLLRLR